MWDHGFHTYIVSCTSKIYFVLRYISRYITTYLRTYLPVNNSFQNVLIQKIPAIYLQHGEGVQKFFSFQTLVKEPAPPP